MLTCWPRFSICRNDLRNQAETKDISTLRRAPSIELGGGSGCDSQMTSGDSDGVSPREVCTFAAD